MKDRYQLFYNWVISQGIEISDKTNEFQCMDLAYSAVFFLNFPKATIQHLFAYEVYTSPTDLTRQYFDLIPNTPDAVPQAMDLVVFDKSASSIAGHIAVATGEGDINFFKSLDQNWAGQSKVSIISHNYDSPKVLGWLRPKIIQPEQTITDQTRIPQIENMEVQAIRSKLIDQATLINNLNISVANLNIKINGLEEQLSDIPQTDESLLRMITGIHDIIWGKGWVWSRMNQLKLLLPK